MADLSSKKELGSERKEVEFDKNAALDNRAFIDFLAGYPDHERASALNNEELKKRFETFWEMSAVDEGLESVYDDELKEALGLNLTAEGKEALRKHTRETAIREPGRIKELKAQLQNHKELVRNFTERGKQIEGVSGLAAKDAALAKLEAEEKRLTSIKGIKEWYTQKNLEPYRLAAKYGFLNYLGMRNLAGHGWFGKKAEARAQARTELDQMADEERTKFFEDINGQLKKVAEEKELLKGAGTDPHAKYQEIIANSRKQFVVGYGGAKEIFETVLKKTWGEIEKARDQASEKGDVARLREIHKRLNELRSGAKALPAEFLGEPAMRALSGEMSEETQQLIEDDIEAMTRAHIGEKLNAFRSSNVSYKALIDTLKPFTDQAEIGSKKGAEVGTLINDEITRAIEDLKSKRTTLDAEITSLTSEGKSAEAAAKRKERQEIEARVTLLSLATRDIQTETLEAEKSRESEKSSKELETSIARARETYIEAYRTFEKTGKGKIIGKGIDKVRAEAQAQLRYKEYENLVGEYGKKLFENKRRALEVKGIKDEKLDEELKKFSASEIFKKCIIDEENAVAKAKAESWPPREYRTLKKGLSLFRSVNPKVRYGISVGIMTGIAVGTGLWATGGALGILKFAGIRYGRAMASPFVIMGAGKMFGLGIKGWDKTFGKEKTLGERLEKLKGQDALMTHLSKRRAEYRDLLETDAKRQKRRNIAKLMISLAAGTGFSVFGGAIDRALNIDLNSIRLGAAAQAAEMPRASVPVEEAHLGVPQEAPPGRSIPPIHEGPGMEEIAAANAEVGKISTEIARYQVLMADGKIDEAQNLFRGLREKLYNIESAHGTGTINYDNLPEVFNPHEIPIPSGNAKFVYDLDGNVRGVAVGINNLEEFKNLGLIKGEAIASMVPDKRNALMFLEKSLAANMKIYEELVQAGKPAHAEQLLKQIHSMVNGMEHDFGKDVFAKEKFADVFLQAETPPAPTLEPAHKESVVQEKPAEPPAPEETPAIQNVPVQKGLIVDNRVVTFQYDNNHNIVGLNVKSTNSGMQDWWSSDEFSGKEYFSNDMNSYLAAKFNAFTPDQIADMTREINNSGRIIDKYSRLLHNVPENSPEAEFLTSRIGREVAFIQERYGDGVVDMNRVPTAVQGYIHDQIEARASELEAAGIHKFSEVGHQYYADNAEEMIRTKFGSSKSVAEIQELTRELEGDANFLDDSIKRYAEIRGTDPTEAHRLLSEIDQRLLKIEAQMGHEFIDQRNLPGYLKTDLIELNKPVPAAPESPPDLVVRRSTIEIPDRRIVFGYNGNGEPIEINDFAAERKFPDILWTHTWETNPKKYFSANYEETLNRLRISKPELDKLIDRGKILDRDIKVFEQTTKSAVMAKEGGFLSGRIVKEIGKMESVYGKGFIDHSKLPPGIRTVIDHERFMNEKLGAVRFLFDKTGAITNVEAPDTLLASVNEMDLLSGNPAETLENWIKNSGMAREAAQKLFSEETRRIGAEHLMYIEFLKTANAAKQTEFLLHDIEERVAKLEARGGQIFDRTKLGLPPKS